MSLSIADGCEAKITTFSLGYLVYFCYERVSVCIESTLDVYRIHFICTLSNWFRFVSIETTLYIERTVKWWPIVLSNLKISSAFRQEWSESDIFQSLFPPDGHAIQSRKMDYLVESRSTKSAVHIYEIRNSAEIRGKRLSDISKMGT